eukprot:628429-Amphidinium_carterae.1
MTESILRGMEVALYHAQNIFACLARDEVGRGWESVFGYLRMNTAMALATTSTRSDFEGKSWACEGGRMIAGISVKYTGASRGKA